MALLYAEQYRKGTMAITEGGWVWEVGVGKWHLLGKRVGDKVLEQCTALPLSMIKGSLTYSFFAYPGEKAMTYATVTSDFSSHTAGSMCDGTVVRDRGDSLYVVCGPDFVKFAGSNGERRYSQLDCVKVSGKVEINIP